MEKVAIMVDGGFYRKRAYYLFGDKNPHDRAEELISYCKRHLKDNRTECDLYRIFYYDCPPSSRTVYHPLRKKTYDLSKSQTYAWTKEFYKELVTKRKVALRLGELLESCAEYSLKPDVLKKLCRKEISIDDLTEKDFHLDIKQKGVDMKIGLDISSLSQKNLVSRIVLIAGDSDFVPAAKHARREGIDFILDPMWQPIKDSLNEHIDGLSTKVSPPPENIHDKLHVNYIPKRK